MAGNFTGHLEQAGEDKDFLKLEVKDSNAPKAVFPTFLPISKGAVPQFLTVFPFDSEKIIYPENENRLQIEPECALIFEVEWKDNLVVSLKPLVFGASNDCSIRKEGAKKISLKKNWGKSSKGLSDNLIPVQDFSENGILNGYRIASFLVRGGKAFQYGEDSRVKDYSYIWKKLTDWMIEKFNYQKDEGPAENISSYLLENDRPSKVMVSIGATRYTQFGETNFLQDGDQSVVVVYPENSYSLKQIEEKVLAHDFSDSDVSFLCQKIVNSRQV